MFKYIVGSKRDISLVHGSTFFVNYFATPELIRFFTGGR